MNSNYPEETNGKKWAAENRRICSKITPKERRAYFRKALKSLCAGLLALWLLMSIFDYWYWVWYSGQPQRWAPRVPGGNIGIKI